MINTSIIEQWVTVAIEKDCNYIISVSDNISKEVDYPIYCKDFTELDRKHDELVLPTSTKRINRIIRVYNDGTFDEDLRLFNI